MHQRLSAVGARARLRAAPYLSAVAVAALALGACTGPAGTAPSSSGGASVAATATGPDVAPAGGITPAATTAAAAVAVGKINLNAATAEQFKTVPGVGDRFVREFNEYRPYTSILQFRRELGKYVSQDQVREWEKFVYVPVNPNQADAETLQQLPGVNATIAQQLISARPYATTDAFLGRLAQSVTAEQAAAARAYLAAG